MLGCTACPSLVWWCAAHICSWPVSSPTSIASTQRFSRSATPWQRASSAPSSTCRLCQCPSVVWRPIFERQGLTDGSSQHGYLPLAGAALIHARVAVEVISAASACWIGGGVFAFRSLLSDAFRSMACKVQIRIGGQVRDRGEGRGSVVHLFECAVQDAVSQRNRRMAAVAWLRFRRKRGVRSR
mmetsp:Transcript_70060/g.176517  ORF Transcript_70060/g.176517 Transcript_70060/m.176517 type:complete len:184 (+) Transcript_70060:644-1195(+)